jgi:DNA-directed RNA polymerase subunit H
MRACRGKSKTSAKSKVDPYQLPEIKSSDPAIIAIGASPGDLVRIDRKSPTAGKFIACRHVIEG